MRGGPEDAMSCLLKIFRFREVDVRNVLLRVAIDQRKPGALYLNHHPMAFAKSMQHILQGQVYYPTSRRIAIT